MGIILRSDLETKKGCKGGKVMAEYINREAVMKFPIWKDHCDKEHANGHFINGIESVLEYVENLPAADVSPVVHARWKYYHKQNKAVCTRCSFERDLDENFGAAISCPNCAAMMDGGED